MHRPASPGAQRWHAEAINAPGGCWIIEIAAARRCGPSKMAGPLVETLLEFFLLERNAELHGDPVREMPGHPRAHTA